MRTPLLAVAALLLSAPAYANPVNSGVTVSAPPVEKEIELDDNSGLGGGAGNTGSDDVAGGKQDRTSSNTTGASDANSGEDNLEAVADSKPKPKARTWTTPAGGRQTAQTQDAPKLQEQKQLAFTLLKGGNKEAAQQVLHEALEQNPQDQDLIALEKLSRDHQMKVDGNKMASRIAAMGSLNESAAAGGPAASGAAGPAGASAPDQAPRPMLASTLGFLAGAPGAQTAAVGGAQVPGALQGTLSRATMTKMKMRDYGGAEKDLTEAISIDDKNWIAYRLRAFVRRYMKKTAEAEQDADRALELNAKDQPSRQIKALLRLDAKDAEGALTEANLAVGLNPKNGDALATRAEALRALGRDEEALADLKAAADLDPQFAAMYRQALYERNGGSEPARQRAFLFGAAGIVLLLLAMALPILKRAHTATRKRTPMRAADRTPQAVQGFRILRRLGQGGMGVVYEAHDETLQRRVALKRMRDEIAMDPRERKRFMREARLVAGLRHPGIVEIFSLVEQDDALYLVFEYLPGETLDALMDKRGGKLAVHEALPLVRQVAEALDFAHAQGVVHQDLKPSNVVVTAERAKVMDFGIARRVQETLSTLSRAEAIGTPAYMAPEQELGQVGPKADVYALGICAYEVLAGRSPFGRSNSVMAKAEGTFPPLSSSAGLPESVDAVFARVFSPDPKKRPSSAVAFVNELEGALKARA